MYGVTFDIDVHELEDERGISCQCAYAEIEAALAALGYRRVQYSVYVCPEPEVSEVAVVHHTINALRHLEWFPMCVRQVLAFEVSQWGNITDEVKQQA